MPDTDASRAAGPEVLAGRYVLGAVLGRGGVADVHVADDTRLSRRVAVKVLRDTADDLSSRERFVREAHLLAQLSHVGIVTVLDAGFTVDRPYLVMELVEGSTLGQLMASGPLPPGRVAEVGALVADALAHAHGHGVVHRDVKPGNVLVRHDGRVKVVDLGIARLIGDTVRHTRTGHAVGTAAYLAPEQVLGQQVGPPADVYALGLVLLEALTGRREYVGTPTEAALARLHRSPEVPTTLPAPWPELLTRMTASDPADRPGAEAVATSLRAAGSAEARTAVLPTVPPPAAPPTSPPPPPAHPPATAVLAPAPGPAPAADRWGDDLAALPRRARDAWTRQTPSTRGAALAMLALVALLLVAALVGRGSDAEPSPVPDDVPADLQGPLSDLHDAVEGG